jgi:hypothetical protein
MKEEFNEDIETLKKNQIEILVKKRPIIKQKTKLKVSPTNYQIERNIWEYVTNLYSNKLENLDEMD